MNGDRITADRISLAWKFFMLLVIGFEFGFGIATHFANRRYDAMWCRMTAMRYTTASDTLGLVRDWPECASLLRR